MQYTHSSHIVQQNGGFTTFYPDFPSIYFMGIVEHLRLFNSTFPTYSNKIYLSMRKLALNVVIATAL